MKVSYDLALTLGCPECGTRWHFAGEGEAECGDLLVGVAKVLHDLEQEHPDVCKPKVKLRLVEDSDDDV